MLIRPLYEYTVLAATHPAPRPPLAMNAPVLPEVLIGERRADEPSLELSSEGIQRYVWNGAFGPMLIEVRDGAAFVNGKRVMSMAELREPALGSDSLLGAPPQHNDGTRTK